MDSTGRFTADNQAAVKHGGAGALKRIANKQPFIGLAREAEQAVRSELAELGRSEIVERNAIRIQAVADLYYHAITKAADDGDIDQLTALVAKFGWLSSKVLLAWDAVKKNDQAKPRGTILDLIKGATNDNDQS